MPQARSQSVTLTVEEALKQRAQIVLISNEKPHGHRGTDLNIMMSFLFFILYWGLVIVHPHRIPRWEGVIVLISPSWLAWCMLSPSLLSSPLPPPLPSSSWSSSSSSSFSSSSLSSCFLSFYSCCPPPPFTIPLLFLFYSFPPSLLHLALLIWLCLRQFNCYYDLICITTYMIYSSLNTARVFASLISEQRFTLTVASVSVLALVSMCINPFSLTSHFHRAHL